MIADEYVPDEEDVRAWCRDGTGDYPDVMDEWLDRFLAHVRRDAALTLAEHFSAEAIDQARQGNPDGADFYRAVAAEIEKQTPEETP